MSAPAFQFYAADFLADANTMVMTTEEVGAYWLLVCVCWREGYLEDDMNLMATIARMQKKKFEVAWQNKIARCFKKTKKGWVHPRLEEERKKHRDLSQKRSEAGKAGAQSKWSKNGDGNCHNLPMAKSRQTMALHSSSSSSSSSSINSLLRRNSAPKTPDGKKSKSKQPWSEVVEQWFAGIPPSLLDEWRETYAGVDIEGVLLRHKNWIRERPNAGSKIGANIETGLNVLAKRQFDRAVTEAALPAAVKNLRKRKGVAA